MGSPESYPGSLFNGMYMDLQRVRALKEGNPGKGPIVYWMNRDQRVQDNWALVYAQERARERNVPLAVAFTLSPVFPGATMRQYDFMLRGLEEVERSLVKHKIPFYLLSGKPVEEMIAFIHEHTVGELVTDFSPLRIHRRWKSDIAKRMNIPFHEVDAHNVVPCWIASDKQEFAAYTFRPKVNRSLSTFLDKFPKVEKQTIRWQKKQLTDWKKVRRALDVDTTVQPVEWLMPGETAAQKVLQQFKLNKLEQYDSLRNDPTESAQSTLSPYLHFGQISAQRVALEISTGKHNVSSREVFLEELIVRRELADNFCFYNKSYDSVEGFPSWARASLDKHRGDRREFKYTRMQFEQSRTHDALWNAAQSEMVLTGKMHGFMRMYWAKKILEWTATPEDAMHIAIFLNDKYQLDGCDPNGYTGIAWSLGGVHDRAWGERKIFGKIRYMNYNGCKRKFDVSKYIANIQKMCRQ